jgi:hypothetical protein
MLQPHSLRPPIKEVIVKKCSVLANTILNTVVVSLSCSFKLNKDPEVFGYFRRKFGFRQT